MDTEQHNKNNYQRIQNIKEQISKRDNRFFFSKAKVGEFFSLAADEINKINSMTDLSKDQIKVRDMLNSALFNYNNNAWFEAAETLSLIDEQLRFLGLMSETSSESPVESVAS